MEIFELFVYLALAAFAGLAIAKYSDVRWRIKMQRNLTKKDYHLAYIVSKDHKQLLPRIFLPDMGTLWYKDQVWGIMESRIFREDNPIDGFKIQKKHITNIDDIPTIFLDEDTFRPLMFDFVEKTYAKPGEIGSSMKAWIVNQEEIARAKAKMLETMLIIAIVVSLASAAIAYWNHTVLETMDKKITSIQGDVTAIRAVIAPIPQNETQPIKATT